MCCYAQVKMQPQTQEDDIKVEIKEEEVEVKMEIVKEELAEVRS